MGRIFFTLWLVLSLCIAVFINLSAAEYDNCYNDVNNVYLACNPPSYDVMWSNVAKINVEPTTATCGTPASKFRRLATRMTAASETCDATIPQLQHPPIFMIDDNTTSTWWQSINLPPDSEELNINITVSFNKTFRMDSDLVITFNSGRPDKMIVLKSVDFGATWTPLQYYAKNCDDFQSVLVPGAAITVDTPTAITCTSEYVEQTPRAVANRTVVLVNQERFDLFLGPIGINFSAFYEAMELKLLNFLTFTGKC
ncbi:Netrin-G1 [Bulinus truncatus]|nr:Netrin-G1 [Bulinus truncatus]